MEALSLCVREAAYWGRARCGGGGGGGGGGGRFSWSPVSAQNSLCKHSSDMIQALERSAACVFRSAARVCCTDKSIPLLAHPLQAHASTHRRTHTYMHVTCVRS